VLAGALVGLAGVESTTIDESPEGRGPARTGPADSVSPGLPPSHLLLLTHHGAVPQGVCLQGGSGRLLNLRVCQIRVSNTHHEICSVKHASQDLQYETYIRRQAASLPAPSKQT